MLDELMPKAARVAALLKSTRETVAVAESSAGGLVAAALLAMPGASAYFLGGAVVYTGAARTGLLGIGPAKMEGLRSASAPYATLLADTVRERLGAAWGIAETGAAGPAGNAYGDAPGHSCLAVTGRLRVATVLETGAADRPANMVTFAAALLDLFREVLEEAQAAPR